jgi:hypothetical protein
MHRAAASLLLVVGLSVVPVVAQGPKSQRVKTEKGVFSVPGTAFMDGRDLEASPPLTVMAISVWETTSRRARSCTLPHGAPVSLARWERVASEDRIYFRVVTEKCEGWVPEVFLSTRRERVVGTRQ